MPCFGKVIVDAKNTYTDYLMSILIPPLYDGFASLYKKSIEYETRFIKAIKINDNIQNPGVMKIFKYFLHSLKKMNANLINDEVVRIKINSKSDHIFDNLIKAVIKSNVDVLMCIANEKIIDDNFYKSIDINAFVHKCYIESAVYVFNNPYLFYHQFSEHELFTNKQLVCNIIKSGIKNSINSILPMSKILETFLHTNPNEMREKYVNKMLNNKCNDINLLDSNDKEIKNTGNIEFDLDDLKDMIYNRNVETANDADPKFNIKTDTKINFKPDAKSDVKLDVKSDVKIGINSDANQGVKSDVKIGINSDANPGVKSDVKIGINSDANQCVKSDVKSDVKIGINSDAPPDVKSDVKIGINSDAKLESRVENKLNIEQLYAGRGNHNIIKTIQMLNEKMHIKLPEKNPHVNSNEKVSDTKKNNVVINGENFYDEQ